MRKFQVTGMHDFGDREGPYRLGIYDVGEAVVGRSISEKRADAMVSMGKGKYLDKPKPEPVQKAARKTGKKG